MLRIIFLIEELHLRRTACERPRSLANGHPAKAGRASANDQGRRPKDLLVAKATCLIKNLFDNRVANEHSLY